MSEPEKDAKLIAFPEASITLEEAYLRGLPSDATRKVYRRILANFAAFLAGKSFNERGLLAATMRDVEAYAAMLLETRTASTVNRSFSALAGFYTYAMHDGQIGYNPAEQARRPKSTDGVPRVGVTRSEVAALLTACNLAYYPEGGAIVRRDRALVFILAVQGLRISEAVNLRWDDIAEEGGYRLAIIRGKGGKVVKVPLAPAVSAALSAWRAVVPSALLLDSSVFRSIRRGGKSFGASLSRHGAEKRIGYLAGLAGIRHIHPHLFRHGAITEALAAGAPLHQVQDFARHADPKTTRKYDSNRLTLANPTVHTIAARLVPSEEE